MLVLNINKKSNLHVQDCRVDRHKAWSRVDTLDAVLGRYSDIEDFVVHSFGSSRTCHSK